MGNPITLQNQSVMPQQAPAADQVPAPLKTVDAKTDSLFDAITKLGGIRSDELAKHWGISPEKLPGTDGNPVAASNGTSITRMAESLADLGYLSRDEYGRADIEEFSTVFDGELRGSKHYAPQGFDNLMRGQAFDTVPKDGQNAIKEQLSAYDTTTEADEADLRAGMDRAPSEIVNEPGNEEGSDGTADQADPRAQTGASAAERPGDAERRASTGIAQDNDLTGEAPDDGADIPAKYFQQIKVPHSVWITDESQFDTIDVSAQEALDSVRDDLNNYRRLRDCMRGSA